MLSKLFPLVKEIRSRFGVLHFRRWRIFESSIFRIYLHQILKSDEDLHEHTHPWNFLSLILWGSYLEENSSWRGHGIQGKKAVRFCFSPGVSFHFASDSHKLWLTEPVWTLVFAFGKKREWGYQTRTSAGFIQHELYREMKNEGMFQ